jgi:hypothetical protein
MAIGTNDKPAREARPGIYSAANSNFAAPFQTTPSAASRQTTNAMDQQLRGMAPPLGLPKVAAPSAPAAAGPITQMSQAAAANYASSPNQVPTIPSMMPRAAQQPLAAPATPRAYAEPEIPANVLQRFAQLQSPNMGIRPQGMDYGTPLPTQQPAQAPANPLEGMRVSDTSVPDIKRVDGGSSPLFTNIDPAQAVQEMRGGTVNTLPASAFTNRSPSDSAAVSAALQAAAARGDWDAVQNAYQRNGGTWQGQTAQQSQEQSLAKLAQELMTGKSRTGMAQGGGLLQQLMQLQQGREQTAANAAANQPTQEGQQLQNEQSRLMLELTQKAIGGDAEALKQLQALQGKDPKNPQVGLLQELMKAWAQGSASGMGNGMPLATMLQEAGPILQMALGMPGATTPAPQQFVDGQTYLDANGNRARFVGGQWVEVE